MTPYTLAPSQVTKDELALTGIPLLDPQGYETRGATLARALRGRYSRELKCFFFTPGRARKWEVLYKAGCTAKIARVESDMAVWRFASRRSLKYVPLRFAMPAAEAVLESQKPMEVEFA